jgi:hypothetical protein
MPLALRHGNRTGIRPYRDRDGNADPIKPRDVAEPGDTHPGGKGPDPRQSIAWGRDPMRPPMKPLRQRLIE